MPPSPHTTPKFVTGSTLKHVINMTATGSIGLAAVFFVDVLNLFYISQLGQKELAAAVGYAGTLVFFMTSLAIGLSIAATALASRALGRGERDQAKVIAGASLVLMAVFMGGAVAIVYPWLAHLLALLGATGDTAALALRFTRWVLPSAVPLGLGMCLAALLRSLGDARRAMYVTLGAGAVSAVLDPLLILGLGWGLDGAATATVLARCSMVFIGLHALLRVHHLFAWPDRLVLRNTLKPFLAIGVPAVLTQVATPVGNAFVTAAKRRLYGVVGIDALAGPSEIVVVADGANNPDWIAADLLSQAEHDPAAQSILITDDAAFADAVLALASDQQRWSDIAEAGWTFVRDHHGIAAGCDAMRPLLNLK